MSLDAVPVNRRPITAGGGPDDRHWAPRGDNQEPLVPASANVSLLMCNHRRRPQRFLGE